MVTSSKSQPLEGADEEVVVSEVPPTLEDLAEVIEEMNEASARRGSLVSQSQLARQNAVDEAINIIFSLLVDAYVEDVDDEEYEDKDEYDSVEPYDSGPVGDETSYLGR